MIAETLLRGLPGIVLCGVSVSQWLLGLAVWRVATGRTPDPATAGLLLVALAWGNRRWMRWGRDRGSTRTSDVLRPAYLCSALISLAAAGGLVAGAAAALVLDRAGLGLPQHAGSLAQIVGVATGLACLTYGFVLGQRRLRIEEVTLRVPDLAPGLHALRIAHLTDLHIGPRLGAAALGRFVERVNATRPDLIVLTGDLFDFEPAYVEDGCRALAKLYAPLGVFAVIGNHDVYTGVETVQRGLTELTEIRLLRDAWVELDVRGAPLVLIGIDDTGRGLADRGIESAALERLARETPADRLRLLLVHRPNYLPQIARLGIPLALAGHTHGGQLSLPPPLERLNVARLTTPWTRGRIQHGRTQLYVNRGLGVGNLSLRWNCPREIALLTLQPEAEPPPHPAPAPPEEARWPR